MFLFKLATEDNFFYQNYLNEAYFMVEVPPIKLMEASNNYFYMNLLKAVQNELIVTVKRTLNIEYI